MTVHIIRLQCCFVAPPLTRNPGFATAYIDTTHSISICHWSHWTLACNAWPISPWQCDSNNGLHNTPIITVTIAPSRRSLSPCFRHRSGARGGQPSFLVTRATVCVAATTPQVKRDNSYVINQYTELYVVDTVWK